jgi:hypothetical protein
MKVVRLGAFINDKHDAALAAQQVVPVNKMMEEGSIAGLVGKVRIIEGAAEATGDALGTGSLCEAEGLEFSGNFGDDSGFGSKDADGEQSKTFERGRRNGFGTGSSETLAKNLIEWEVSGHE